MEKRWPVALRQFLDDGTIPCSPMVQSVPSSLTRHSPKPSQGPQPQAQPAQLSPHSLGTLRPFPALPTPRPPLATLHLLDLLFTIIISLLLVLFIIITIIFIVICY